MDRLMSDGVVHSLSIGELSARTDVPVATLRSWEQRYGFPSAAREAGRHRRFSEGDVEDVLQVKRHRSAGLGLAAAVRRVAIDSGHGSSVFAQVRRLHPELTPRVMSKAALTAVSHAIEDECCARAALPRLFGGFQTSEFLRASRIRWNELARTSQVTVAFVDVASASRRNEAPSALMEIPTPAASPLRREWFVICDAEDLPALLIAVELPASRPRPDGGRTFEMVWSADPAVVRSAARVAAALADDHLPGQRSLSDLIPFDDPAPASEDLRRAGELFDRVIGYLDRTLGRRESASRPDAGPAGA
ncbi:DICT sensory domain-containing protein [Aeromicrobium sp.]|uniref:DICT sensory domain-containing protein n=1 Tax=Aeromicrobium sp. TaxID=1871063 RepID=UPI0025C151A2|nr:DICT sensory domain-containing protein [Aeromicrobium sp.]MCK5891800.1 MerR family transcriptional regulator [Aeromicrobium sp.]